MNDNHSKENYIKQLKKLHKTKRLEISNRLEDFRRFWDKGDKDIFSELCFCILTPQSKAQMCDNIIRTLKNNGLLFKGNFDQIKPFLKNARFYRNKSRYLIEARKVFQNKNKLNIKKRLNINDTKATREWLVKNIKGIGYKEASHFLRNIGRGENLAILDIHILRNLERARVIKNMPKSLTKKRYLEIENRLEKFSNKIKIPMSHLDLLFWSIETGKIFK